MSDRVRDADLGFSARRRVSTCVRHGTIAVTLGLVASCTSSLQEVRAREAEWRFRGVPPGQQREAARCIRDGFYRRVVGPVLVAQEIEETDDGLHVVGRNSVTPAAAMFDVAIREGEVLVMIASSPLTPREPLRNAIDACLATGGS